MRRVVLVGMTLVAMLIASSSAAADVGIAPTIQCYTQDAQSGLVTVTWGYVDTNASSSVLPLGALNFFSPPPSFQGQPDSFDPGVFPHVFQTTFDPTLVSSQTWNLGGMSATFAWPNTAYPVCGGPVPGPAGPAGPQGPPGQNGTNGTNGTNGNTILSGAGAPSDTLGSDGDWYIDTSTHTMYGPKAGGHWPTTGFSLVGPQGATGQKGATGPQGPQGPPGVPVCRNTIAARVLCSALFVPGTWVVGGGSVHGDFALARRHTIYAKGSSTNVRQGKPITFSMRKLRRVTPGRYTLTVRLRSHGFRLTARRTVTVT